MIKSRTREEVYDRLYVLAEKVLTKKSVCSTCPIRCNRGVSKSWCCEGCPFLGEGGCTTQALGCKLWLCAVEQKRQTGRSINGRLAYLEAIGKKYKILLARASREQSLMYGETYGFWKIYDERSTS